MQFFMRMSKLSNIVGRADYISNPARQEHIVLARSYADWKPYQEFERTHRKSSKANNEGRELIIALPNEWGQLGEIELASRMNELAQKILPGKTEYQWAIHWNKAHTNLHIHLIFSERDRQYTSSGVWDRDIYLTKDGKVARRKADRAVDRMQTILWNNESYQKNKTASGIRKSDCEAQCRGQSAALCTWYLAIYW